MRRRNMFSKAASSWPRGRAMAAGRAAPDCAIGRHGDAGGAIVGRRADIARCLASWGSVRCTGRRTWRGVLFGLTRNTSPADLARAVLEGVALQVVDLIAAADQDMGKPLDTLRVDGGMTRNAWFLQCQANLLGRPVLAAWKRKPDWPLRFWPVYR